MFGASPAMYTPDVSRIRKAFEAGYLALLRQANARRPENGLRRLVELGERLRSSRQISEAAALLRIYQRLARQPYFRRRRSWPGLKNSAAIDSGNANRGLRFFCDSGLGGLARWLWACGYEAYWEAYIDDSELLRRAQSLRAIVLTTDSMLLERRLVRDQVIPTFWLPPILRIPEQLEIVFGEFGLTPGEPRCMNCGGQLERRDKEQLRGQIPPRTYRWLDEYFVCRSCGQLFWHGTHWEKIRDRLRRSAGATSRS